MKRGRKGYGEELNLIERYSQLSELYFQRLKERLESDDKKDQDFAIDKLNGVFIKMIPQDVNNNNFNTEPIPLTKEEQDDVKHALLKSVPDSGIKE